MNFKIQVVLILLILVFSYSFAGSPPMSIAKGAIYNNTDLTKAIETIPGKFELPFYEGIKVSPGEIFNAEDTEFVPIEHAGQAAVVVYSGGKIVSMFAENSKFFKTNYSGALSGLVKLHMKRTENLISIKFAKLLTENGRLAYGPGSLNPPAAKNALRSRLQNIASNADDALVKSKAAKVLAEFDNISVGANYSDEFINILRGVGLKPIPANMAKANPLKHVLTNHKALTGKMLSKAPSSQLVRLQQLGYEVTVHEVHGLKVVNKATQEVFEIPGIKGLKTIDDVDDIILKTALKKTPQITGNLTVASQAVEALRAKRLSSLEKAFRNYSNAGRGTKWYYKGKLTKAVTAANKAGLKAEFSGGFLKGVNGRVLNSVDDVGRYVKPTNAVVALSKPGIIAKISQKLATSAAGGSKIAGATLKTGQVVTKVGGKVLRVASVAAIPTTVVKAAAYGYCAYTREDFVPPGHFLDEISANGKNPERERFSEYESDGKVTSGVFRLDSNIKYKIEPNAESNVYRVRNCLKALYDTEERNLFVKGFVWTTEFLNPATLVEDLVNWANSEEPILSYCNWKVYSDVYSAELDKVEFEKILSCEPDVDALAPLMSNLPNGRYHFALFVNYDPTLYALLEDPKNPETVQLNATAIYKRYGSSCNSQTGCYKEEGMLGGIATIKLENSDVTVMGPVTGEKFKEGYIVGKIGNVSAIKAKNWSNGGEKWDFEKYSAEHSIRDSSGVIIASTLNGKMKFFEVNGDWYIVIDGLKTSDSRSLVYTWNAIFTSKDKSTEKGIGNIVVSPEADGSFSADIEEGIAPLTLKLLKEKI